MLLNLRDYYRPGEVMASGRRREGLKQALALLSRAGGQAVALAGGSSLLASGDPAIEAVIDLQGLGLEQVEVQEDRVRIGAMVTRASLAEQEHAFREAGGRDARWSELSRLGVLAAQAAARWGGSVQRNRATVGGAVALAAPEDLLVLAFLAADARVVLESAEGSRDMALADFLAERTRVLAEPALITDLVLSLPAMPVDDVRCGTAMASVARTPADVSIVAAVAVVWRAQGRCAGARLALGGVGKEPVSGTAAEARLIGQPWSRALVAEVAGEVGAAVQPNGDFRGSAAYRQAMASVLSQRALMEAWKRAE